MGWCMSDPTTTTSTPSACPTVLERHNNQFRNAPTSRCFTPISTSRCPSRPQPGRARNYDSYTDDCRKQALLLKTHSREIRRNFIALGCAINDVLDFGEHFISPRGDRFFKRRRFSTPTRGYTQNPSMSAMDLSSIDERAICERHTIPAMNN